MSEGDSSGTGAPPEAAEAGTRFRSAFQRMLPAIHALPESKLAIINLDIQDCVTTALGVVPKLRVIRAEVAKVVHPDFDMSGYDELEDHALALAHAHGLFLIASEPEVLPEEVMQEVIESRKTLLLDAETLAHRTVIPANRLGLIKSRVGRQNAVFDLSALVELFRDHWPAIEGKTAVTLGELQGLELLAARVLKSMGLDEQTQKDISEATKVRRRAFTRFIAAYNQVRRVILFTRWDEEDADEIAPSLYAGKTRRKDGKDKPEAVSPGAAQAAPTEEAAAGKPGLATGASPSTGASQLAGGTPAGAASSAAATQAPSPPVKEGFRGGSPFTEEP